jgi:hypothetical protein
MKMNIKAVGLPDNAGYELKVAVPGDRGLSRKLNAANVAMVQRVDGGWLLWINGEAQGQPQKQLQQCKDAFARKFRTADAIHRQIIKNVLGLPGADSADSDSKPYDTSDVEAELDRIIQDREGMIWLCASEDLPGLGLFPAAGNKAKLDSLRRNLGDVIERYSVDPLPVAKSEGTIKALIDNKREDQYKDDFKLIVAFTKEAIEALGDEESEAVLLDALKRVSQLSGIWPFGFEKEHQP